MSDYEHIVISAVRYALGRMTYIVSLTVEYVIKEIEKNQLSRGCLQLIKRDIEGEDYLGMPCEKREWKRLLYKINEVIK